MDLAERIVAGIETDLCDRRGLRQAFEECDDEVQHEIRAAWAKIVRNRIRRAERAGLTSAKIRRG